MRFGGPAEAFTRHQRSYDKTSIESGNLTLKHLIANRVEGQCLFSLSFPRITVAVVKVTGGNVDSVSRRVGLVVQHRQGRSKGTAHSVREHGLVKVFLYGAQ